MTSHIVHLIGHAGVGKLTTARALAIMIDALVVDNHWINNPVFGLLRNDRMTQFPDAVWNEMEKVRSAVLDTIATIAPLEQSYILTNVLYHGDTEDHAIATQVRDTAQRRGSIYVPVRLICSAEEVAQRITSPARAARFKSMDAQAARANASRPTLATGVAEELTLDTSSMSAEAVAETVAKHLESLRIKS